MYVHVRSPKIEARAMAEAVEKRPFLAGSVAAKRVGLPFIAIAAFTLVVIHHFVKRKPGGKKLGKGNGSEDLHNATELHDDDVNGTDSSQPLTIEELRARRVRALDSGAGRLTPLGTLLRLSRKIDELETQVTNLLDKKNSCSPEMQEDLANCLRQSRADIDNVKSDDSVREIKKAQAGRVDLLLKELQRGRMLVGFVSWFKSFFFWTQPAEQYKFQAENRFSGITLTRRRDASVAEWNEETGKAMVKLRKGKLWNNTGVIRNGLLFCHVEEAVFLTERGILILNHKGSAMELKQIYELLSIESYGCSLDAYQVYSYFKTLGYVLGRHGVGWTNKTSDFAEEFENKSSTPEELRLMFDVFPPNSQFKKTASGLPSFSLCVSRVAPSRQQVKGLEEESQVPIKFAVVNSGHVGIFSFSTVELPSL